nr:HAD family phosphatase [Chitinophagaceae bacterium]
MDGIKNIIFDFGGVILNIDYNLSVLAFKKLGIADFEEMYSKMKQNDLFDKLETGVISQNDFVSEIQKHCPDTIHESDIVSAWNAMLLDFPLRRLQILQQLQLHFNTFLLSNTNAIHEAEFNKRLQQTCGYPTMAVFFDKIYLSHRVGMRKPSPEIFEKILIENNLQAAETLFIDDSIQHIEGAQKVGIQTIHLSEGMTIEEDIFKNKNAG